MVKGDLDPTNWDEFRTTAHRMLDASITKMENADQGRVWTPLPQDLRDQFNRDLPRTGSDPEQVMNDIMPYGAGNTHPRFLGWVHGAGAPSGVLADIIGAAMNVNAGGRDHIAPVVERQVVRWCADIMGFGDDASGLVVSGTSLATIIALKVARDKALPTVRGGGIADARLVGYTSKQTHTCVKRAFDMLGLGSDALRMVPCNDAFEMDLDALNALIAADRADGLQPFCVIGTAGAVNMGAIDDLDGIADIAKRENLWFHVDGAFGATARVGQLARDQLAGVSRADSLAFDFHKWLQTNYESGIVLIKDESAHRHSFSDRPEYLRGTERGLAGGAFWAVDYGPELSRGFRALKVWAHLVEHGIDKLGASIDRNIETARYLQARVEREPKLEMLAPVPLNINCFRFVTNDVNMDAINEEIVIQLQESGIAVPSTTQLNGQLAIRVNITNHRTQNSDMDLLVDEILRLGEMLSVAAA
ncbi:cytochrome d ubiquinol oxidase subunit I [Amylibacter ulvae]|uniref:Cytochrome d ubiquinol oxidase subunit I n=1 Tax=Paramylibacter ulvae TaxID=1651968 RepID=A0ABQ3D2I0_9RHOB|nr:pyridoxal-dependent decarboxylase [Amylibacter ulvae]GHA55104.1 cytochrome d ubiquinol oxidase subunit I [Amylibacter ulvae]